MNSTERKLDIYINRILYKSVMINQTATTFGMITPNWSEPKYAQIQRFLDGSYRVYFND